MSNAQNLTASTADKQTAALILTAAGKQPHEVCDELGIASSTLWRWMENDTDYNRQMTQAREIGLQLLAGQLVTIPDTYLDVNKARLKSDNIKWLIARLLSRMFGDRLDVNVNQRIDIAGTLIEARNRTLQPVCNQITTDYAQVLDCATLSPSESTDKESAPGEPSIFD